MECPICLQDFMDGEDTMYLPCAHKFHTACIEPALERSEKCPVCRISIHARISPDGEVYEPNVSFVSPNQLMEFLGMFNQNSDLPMGIRILAPISSPIGSSEEELTDEEIIQILTGNRN